MLGILCGLEAEAAIARRMSGAVVACSSARADKARDDARKLIEQGATRLLSFGLAGGLKPGLAAGSLVIGTAVCAVGESLPCNAEMIGALRQSLPGAQSGPVWASDTILTRAGDKRALYHQSNCLSADMESRAVALAAAEARVPFAVLRAVADTAEMDLPPAALVPLRYDGRVNFGGVLRSLLRHPAQFPSLVKLGYNARLALKALQRGVTMDFPRGFA